MRSLVPSLALIGFVLAGCKSTGVVMPERINPAVTLPSPVAPQTGTALPTIDPLATATPTGTAIPISAATPTFVVPTLTAYPNDQVFSLGKSVEGRDIWAWQFGDGPRTIVLIGGMHGGFEANTVVLSEELVDHFRLNPSEILPGIRLVIIPVSNPDGLTRGSGIEGRFNANEVDLNRNWGCDWQPTAVLRDIEVDPGPRPFSEPESLHLRAYFIAEPPDAVLFYHSSAGGIFLGQCGDEPAARWLGELLEDATDYPYETSFDYYKVSGDATNWLAERGIPAAVIELFSRDDTEFAKNLSGVMALQCHFAVEENQENLDIQPILERYCELNSTNP